MSAANREPSVASEPEQVEEPESNPLSLSRAVLARKSEYVRPHRIRIKVGTWNVAGCPGTDKDLASWFIDGKGVEPQLDAKLARLSVSESIETIEINKDHNATSKTSADPKADSRGRESHNPGGSPSEGEEPDVRLLSGDKIGLYVLGLQEVVDLNIVSQTFYSDPNAIAKWQDALEAALPKGYHLVASEQLVGLLLLIYASPEVAETITNESTVSVGTGIYGLLGYWGNKGGITSRILLGETTRLVFTNSHLASGHEQASLDHRCWDYNRIISQTKFSPINLGGVAEDEGEKIGDEDFAFWLGDLNFRLDGLPGEDIRRLLTLHTRGEYDLNKKSNGEMFSDDGVIVLRNNDDDDDGTNTPGMISREASFDKTSSDEDSELPDPDEFLPDPNDDPASLQATLNSLLPHDQLLRMIKERKAFHEGWHEGPITFLPTYKYDVGTVGLFDSSEKQRAPSWCDRILYRTRTDVNLYEKKCNDEVEAKKRDEDMKKMGIDKAAEDENVLFDYDPAADSSADNLGDTTYDYDDYDEGETLEQVITKEGFVDKIHLDTYTSHQRVTSSDHKPIVAIFTLDYDAVVPELKAKVHAEVARELDRAENEGRPGLTVIVDAKDSINKDNKHFADGSDGVDFGELGFLRKENRYLTIANTGRVPATFCFIENPIPQNDATKPPQWLQFKFVRSQVGDDEETQDPLEDEITLEPGETVNAVIEAHVQDIAHVQSLNADTAQLDDVLILRVTDGRDHFIPIKATWIPSCFGRSLEELIRVPRGGGVRGLIEKRQKGGSIPYTLEVHKSSPNELFQLTEAIAILAERAIADANMLDEVKIPRDKPGWPFDKDSWQTTNDEDHEILRASMIGALEVDDPVLESIGVDVPIIKRLEIVSEVLLLFLRSMPDGIITTPLWAKIEQSLPNIGSGKTPAEAEEARSTILDILATAPYYNISFVFLMSMLTRVANELVSLSKEALEALNNRRTSSPGTLAKRSLSFRRSAGGAVAADQAAILRRLAWERKTAEIFGVAICRAPTSTNAKEKKATEDKMRGVVEVFLRQDRT
ncbi:DNase I-like protein [Annulohypoxylon maeteangense]|uniref:DNase I-like protein n=1 Tax=Annulohypoxylon maeteangense TaxID=1927788 RepID=UPI002007B715|nr:DNase I-like protein [Annulohypoxylon maeteangense]KAI0884208.1 DNase I-like protein [Annulohypoxylon maeteangense]